MNIHHKSGFKLLIAAAALSASAGAAADPARSVAAAEQQLEQKVDELSQQLQELKAQLSQLKAQNQALQQQQQTTQQAVQQQAQQQAVTQQQQAAAAQAQPAGVRGASMFDNLSLWGYGEVYYTRPIHQPSRSQADLARAVFGIGYTFDERTSFNSEYEVEHAVSSSSDPGEFEVEQFYVDHQPTPATCPSTWR
jgi:TolA-binding protein